MALGKLGLECLLLLGEAQLVCLKFLGLLVQLKLQVTRFFFLFLKLLRQQLNVQFKLAGRGLDFRGKLSFLCAPFICRITLFVGLLLQGLLEICDFLLHESLLLVELALALLD